MKASRPLGGMAYAETRPPACETCAHPRDRDSGGNQNRRRSKRRSPSILGAFLRSAGSANRGIGRRVLKNCLSSVWRLSPHTSFGSAAVVMARWARSATDLFKWQFCHLKSRRRRRAEATLPPSTMSPRSTAPGAGPRPWPFGAAGSASPAGYSFRNFVPS